MERFRDQPFSRAALALDQNSRATWRDLRDEIEDLKHRLALTDDVLEAIALFEGALELNVFFFGLALENCRPDIRQELLVVPWLLNEVGRAGVNGADCVLDSAVRSNHDDRKVRITLSYLAEDFQTIAVRERVIE